MAFDHLLLPASPATSAEAGSPSPAPRSPRLVRDAGALDRAPVVRIECLGVARVLVAGRDARIALQRGLALLAYLARLHASAPRRTLAALLWPESSETVARARLRRLVYQLESEVEHKLFEASGDHLALARHGVQVDLDEFSGVARAALGGESGATLDELQAWADRASLPLLDGMGFASPPFEEWLRVLRVEHEHLLAGLLRHLAAARSAAGESERALPLVEKLLQLDPYSERDYVLLMDLHARQGHVAGVEGAYMRCAEALRGEFGIRPDARTEEAYLELIAKARRGFARADAANDRLPLRFARTEGGTIAYAVLGSGPQTLISVPGFVSHLEIAWEDPALRRFYLALASRFRVVLFDRRGVGLSERLGAPGTPEATAADVNAVLDDAGIDHAWLFGASAGATSAVYLATACPQRVDGLVLFGGTAKGSWAEDHPWALTPRAFDVWLRRLLRDWGGPTGLEAVAPSHADDPAVRAWWARLIRHAASPASLELVLQAQRDADVRPLLPHVKAPTLVMHRAGDRAAHIDGGRELARRIPGAKFVKLDGQDHWWWRGNADDVLTQTFAFVGGRG